MDRRYDVIETFFELGTWVLEQEPGEVNPPNLSYTFDGVWTGGDDSNACQ